MNSKVFRYYALITFLITMLGSITFSQMQREEDIISIIKGHANWNYPDFALEKIKSNKIVMLADEGHGTGLYMQTVIEVLYHWVNMYEANYSKGDVQGIPQKLFLVLENDSAVDKQLRKYFISGDLIDVVHPAGFWNYQFSNATLEFLTDLRSLRLHIDSLNKSNFKSSPLQFDIFCPEKTIDDSNWTVEKRDKYFAFERDEYSSAKVIKLLEDQQDAHAFIFYGGGHFLLGQQPKPPEKPVGKGYYLAHYLRKQFQKQGGVYLCDQISIPQTQWLDNAFKKIDRSFAIDDSCWQDVPISIHKSFPHYDGAIFHTSAPDPSWHMSRFLSETMIDLILQDIDRNKNIRNEFQRGNLHGWFPYLSTFTDKDYYMPITVDDSLTVEIAIKEIKQWRQSTKIDVVADISNLSIWKRLVERIRNNPDPKSTWYQMLLADYIGFIVWYQYCASPQVRADAAWKYIERYKKYITIDNLISVLWIGTAEEKEKALVALKQESGQNFETPKEWAHWFLQAKL